MRSRTGDLIVIGQAGAVRIRDATTGQVRPGIRHAAAATTLTLDDDGVALALGGTDGSITISVTCETAASGGGAARCFAWAGIRRIA